MLLLVAANAGVTADLAITFTGYPCASVVAIRAVATVADVTAVPAAAAVAQGPRRFDREVPNDASRSS